MRDPIPQKPRHGCGYDDRLCKTKHEAVGEAIDLHFKIIEERLNRTDMALELQAREVERRMEENNHWRKVFIKEREDLLKRETYEIKTAYYDEWCKTVDKQLTEINSAHRTWTAAIAIFFVLVQIALHLLWK